ncbi:MAG: DUF3375 domain-containing protein [Leptospirales bacterium]
MTMDYHFLDSLRRTHPGWRLLSSDHAPLVISFLHDAFIGPNIRSFGQEELVSRLDDTLFQLRETMGEGVFPRSAIQYLDDWASDQREWLRKYYLPGNDEPRFDLTPAAEKAIDWIASLGQRQFVGTQSRLLTVFELLRQMVEGTESDPETRLSELEKRKSRIEEEIRQIQAGRMDFMDPALVKDRFLQMSMTARGLLSDFREVEQNFRNLYRVVRERIATWEEGKGALMEEIFGERDAIVDSDQGKSFRVFWDFLMSPARQEELSDLLEKAFALEPVQDLHPDPRLLRIHYDWMVGGESAQRTVARLSSELRRYLDDKAWLENRRIMQVIRDVEQSALSIRDRMPPGTFMEVDEPSPSIELPMERPLYSPPVKATILQQILLEGEEDVPSDALFEQVYVDRMERLARIRRALSTRSQISLSALLDLFPLEEGLEELVVYLSLASEDPHAVIEDGEQENVRWKDARGVDRRATVPLVVFTR